MLSSDFLIFVTCFPLAPKNPFIFSSQNLDLSLDFHTSVFSSTSQRDEEIKDGECMRETTTEEQKS